MTYLCIFAFSTILVKLYSNAAYKVGMVDIPNHRTSHQNTTPRGGGLVFMVLWMLFIYYQYLHQNLSQHLSQVLLIPTIIVTSISFLDDYFNLRRRYRLIAHVLTAAFAAYLIGPVDVHLGSHTISASFILTCVASFYIIWSINLFNFMDGLDGQAGFQAFFICFVSGLLLLIYGDTTLAHVSLLLAFGVLGFLVWNWPNAKVFMGDVGSTGLGVLIAIFSLLSQQSSKLPFSIYLMLYMPFLFDATLTLLRRMISGEDWYEPHNKHAFQRLYQTGWSHHKILTGLILIDVIILGLIASAIYFPQYLYSFFLIELMLLGYVYHCIECVNPMDEQPMLGSK
jgi:Fuc2NAc and GlcNAc transferase